MQHRPAQFAEETKRADKNVAYGLITSTVLEAAMGLAFVLSFLFCLPVRVSPWSHYAEMTGPTGICDNLPAPHSPAPEKALEPCNYHLFVSACDLPAVDTI